MWSVEWRWKGDWGEWGKSGVDAIGDIKTIRTRCPLSHSTPAFHRCDCDCARQDSCLVVSAHSRSGLGVRAGPADRYGDPRSVTSGSCPDRSVRTDIRAGLCSNLRSNTGNGVSRGHTTDDVDGHASDADRKPDGDCPGARCPGGTLGGTAHTGAGARWNDLWGPCQPAAVSSELSLIHI